MRFLFILCSILFSLSAHADKKVVVFRNEAGLRSFLNFKSFSFQQGTFFSYSTAKVSSIIPTAKVVVVDNLSDLQILLLENDPEVVAVLKNKKYRINPDVSPSPSPESFTYGLVNTNVVNYQKEHPDTNGEGVTVGIIDTGIDPNHPDLLGKTVAFKDFTKSNGNNEELPYDDNGHGTHVAGTIAGGRSSGVQIGIAPKAKLVIAKVFTAEGGANTEEILLAMEWMKNQNVVLVSNSWGGSQDETDLEKEPFYAMAQAWVDKGIIPVFAAGNEGPNSETVGSPGGLPNVVGVGATNSDNKVAPFSSRGPIYWKENAQGKLVKYIKPDIAAPGVKIKSSLPDGKYGNLSGTSMATPHVSGVLALYAQEGRLPKTPSEVKEMLCEKALKLADKPENVGCGLLQMK